MYGNNVAGSASASFDKTATDRPSYGYESARDRQAEARARIGGQIDRLSNILDPVLEGEVPSIGKDGSIPGYASKLLQELNNDAGQLEYLSDRLESIIQRIRL